MLTEWNGRTIKRSIIKNDYNLNITDLNRRLTQIKQLINEERPVKELNYMTPVAFEKWLQTTTHPLKTELYDFRKQCEGTFLKTLATKKV